MRTAESWVSVVSPIAHLGFPDEIEHVIKRIQADALRHASGIVATQEALWPSFKAIRETLDEQINQLESALKK